MFKKIFENPNLKCQNCGREIQPGEEIYVHLILPEQKQMPVGALDKMLGKHSQSVYCMNCKQIQE